MVAEAETTSDNPPQLEGDQIAGCVMTFGQGDCGQLGLGEDMTERKKPYPVTGLLEGLKITQIECGGMHTVVLTDDGKVTYCTTHFCVRLHDLQKIKGRATARWIVILPLHTCPLYQWHLRCP